MRIITGLTLVALATLVGCGDDGEQPESNGLAALAGPSPCDTGAISAVAVTVAEAGAEPAAVERPFRGRCHVTLLPRVHDDSGGCGGGEEGGCGGEDEGGCGGEDDEGSGGGAPIARHYDLVGSCTLTHLGRTDVTGRLNFTGPFGVEGHSNDGHATLGARGRLNFVAANGDRLVGRYIPVTATFTPEGEDGGSVVLHSTEQFNLRCADPGGGAGAHGGGEAEDTSTGRFRGASGESSFTGRLRILRSTKSGAGSLEFETGELSY